MVVEQVFGWPGMGSLLFWGIENRDYPVVMGVTVVIALAVLLTNLLLDLAYGLADPRVRYGRGRPVERCMLSRSPWERFRSDRRAVACLLILCAELLAVLLLPRCWGWSPTPAIWGGLQAPLRSPSPGHRRRGPGSPGPPALRGRVSLLIGLCSAALSALVGIPLGLLAGYRRGAWEFCLMRLADVFQSFPSIVLVLCLVSLVGPSALNLVLVLGLLGWTGIARLVYGNTLSVREKEYVLAARALGGRTGRILRSNVLPNVIAPVWCALPLRAGRAILSESSLSFLGWASARPRRPGAT